MKKKVVIPWDFSQREERSSIWLKLLFVAVAILCFWAGYFSMAL